MIYDNREKLCKSISAMIMQINICNFFISPHYSYEVSSVMERDRGQKTRKLGEEWDYRPRKKKNW